MYGPTDGQWKFFLWLAAIGAVSAVFAVAVGIPTVLWWAFHHISIH